MINFRGHPEYGGDSNQLLSGDIVHWLRDGVENGLVGPDGEMVPGVGGVAVFFQSAVGSRWAPSACAGSGGMGRCSATRSPSSSARPSARSSRTSC